MKSILPASVLLLFFINNILCDPATENNNYYGSIQQDLYPQTLCLIKSQKDYVENLERNFTQQLSNIEQVVRNYTLEMASLKETVLEQKKRIDTLEGISCNQSLQNKTLTDKNNTYGSHQDCASLFKSGYTTSGVYTIHIPSIPHPVRVYCDMQHEGGGWTVLQRRLNGDVPFYQPWSAYKSGFGNVRGEYWLGNDILAAMTGKARCLLRIELTKFSNETGYAEYSNFRVGSESDNYRLTVGQYTGTAGDGGHGMSDNNNFLFTTFDRQNDGRPDNINCADPSIYGGGWWYSHYCGYVNLNGPYSHVRMRRALGDSSIFWEPFDKFYSLLTTEMKFRPMGF